MNAIQKATTACVALIITVVGATLVTAPLALADVHRVSLHQVMSAPYAVLNDSSGDAGLTAGLRHQPQPRLDG